MYQEPPELPTEAGTSNNRSHHTFPKNEEIDTQKLKWIEIKSSWMDQYLVITIWTYTDMSVCSFRETVEQGDGLLKGDWSDLNGKELNWVVRVVFVTARITYIFIIFLLAELHDQKSTIEHKNLKMERKREKLRRKKQFKGGIEALSWVKLHIPH